MRAASDLAQAHLPPQQFWDFSSMTAWLHKIQRHIDLLLCRVNRDLGQFERFRRIFHTPYYSVLLSHLQYTPLSSLQVRTALHGGHSNVHSSCTGIIDVPIHVIRFFRHGTELPTGL